jgi:ubiquinone/menaquinone biosynthesis C-methylase UbiE
VRLGQHLLTASRFRPIIAALKNTDEYRRASHEVWEAMAPGWERGRAYIWDVTRAVGERMVAALDPKPGDTVLELAAGTGETGFAAARMVGPDGRLLSTDFSPAMVDAARRRGTELGLENVDYRVLDAEQMDLPDASVDGVLCRYGYMLMADPAAALAETRRVLKPGGRLSFAVVGAPESNPWATVPGRVLVELGHAPSPEPGAPGIFAMADEARIRELVTGAGFDPPQVEDVEVVWSFADDEELWRFLTGVAGGIALVIRSLPEDEQSRVRSEVERASEPLRSNGGYDMPGLTLNVLAQ